jgi:cysteine sulfinate desulfinase/cysteine desulfurase-like protein
MRNRRDIPRDYLRFSFGLANTRQEVDQAISVLVESISVLRELTLD